MRAWIIHTRCGDDYVFGWKIRSLSSAREKHCLTRDAIQQCGCEVIKPLLDDGRCIFNEAARWDWRTGVISSEGRPAPRSRDLTGSQTEHVGNILITCSIRTFKICWCVNRSQDHNKQETFHRCRKRTGHFSALTADCVGSVVRSSSSSTLIRKPKHLLFVIKILLKSWKSLREPRRCQRYVLLSPSK